MCGGKSKARMLTGIGARFEDGKLIKFLRVLESIKQEDSLVLESAARVYLQRLSVIWSSLIVRPL